ncbi:hypothetical protein BaRGS_00029243 [Batillaria attramentaria]|uniref:Uncharacterized protein n=1 Tax=Batillaria attramentaria TaxID=370345 RepID=A0ABD0JWU3_9CAEN
MDKPHKLSVSVHRNSKRRQFSPQLKTSNRNGTRFYGNANDLSVACKKPSITGHTGPTDTTRSSIGYLPFTAPSIELSPLHVHRDVTRRIPAILELIA